VLAAEIAEDLRSALEQIENVLADLQRRADIAEPNKVADGAPIADSGRVESSVNQVVKDRR
jgi:hypothetical protein